MDGGVNYYRRFANPLPVNKFPIATWLSCVNDQGEARSDRSLGINTYVGVCETGQSAVNLVRRNTLKMLATREMNRAGYKFGRETAGWILEDEIDMTEEGPRACTRLPQIKASLPKDGRLRYANYGKGVLFWHTDAQASCFVNAVDIVSTDTYWYSDPYVCGRSEGGGTRGVVTANDCHVASNYGWQVRRVRSLVRPRGSKPVWAFVDLGRVMSNITPTPPQVRAAVWHSLIAGARGIQFFTHSFHGGCDTINVLRESCWASVRPRVKAISSEVQSLRRALNGPSLASGFRRSTNVRATAKWDGRHFYVFAGTAGYTSGVKGTFSIRCVRNATANVLGENRSVPVRNGVFSDTFADSNTIHLYRIEGGSTCGLS